MLALHEHEQGLGPAATRGDGPCECIDERTVRREHATAERVAGELACQGPQQVLATRPGQIGTQRGSVLDHGAVTERGPGFARLHLRRRTQSAKRVELTEGDAIRIDA